MERRLFRCIAAAGITKRLLFVLSLPPFELVSALATKAGGVVVDPPRDARNDSFDIGQLGKRIDALPLVYQAHLLRRRQLFASVCQTMLTVDVVGAQL